MAIKRNLSAAAPRPSNPADPIGAKGLSWPAVLAAMLSIAVLPLASLQASAAASALTSPATPTGRVARLAQVPLSFEPNQGQTDARVQFLSRGRGYSLYLTPGEVVLDLEEQKTKAQQAAYDTLRMKLLHANASAQVNGLDPLSGRVNYFLGKDPNQWRSNIPTFGKVKYAEVYPGIDLVFYGNQRQLEYDFLVAPGADLSRIAWQIDGATAGVAADGSLQLHTSHGPASFGKPVIYQQYDAARTEIPGAFQVSGNLVRFTVGAYDHSKPLVIDPVLSYSTYLGGAADSSGTGDGSSVMGGYTSYYPTGVANPTQGIAIDREGNSYVAGYTNATDFPVENAYQSGDSGLDSNYRAASAFVTKFNSDGTSLIYSTYLSGGEGQTTEGTAIAVDSEGSAYVTGFTNEVSFPVTAGAYQTICGADYDSSGHRTPSCGGEATTNGFLTKLSPSGNSLEYSTFLGGQALDQIFAIAVDAKGQAYVAGNSLDECDLQNQPKFVCFPTTSGAVLSGLVKNGYNGNAFLSVFDAKGASLLYSTFLGDDPALESTSEFRQTNVSAVTVDPAGNVYVAGLTAGTHLPTTSGAYQTKSLQGQCCASFIAKFSPVSASGAKLTYLTYLSGPNAGYGAFISGLAANADGEVYAAGLNTDQNFPTTKGAFQTSCGVSHDLACRTAFVSKLNAAGSELVWSTLLGDKLNGQGVPVGAVGPVQLDAAGNVYVTGSSAPNFYDFPQVNPIQPASVSDGSPFITEFNPTGSKVLFSTFFGDATGNSIQSAAGLAVDAEGNMYVAGNTDAGGIPTTPGAFQKSFVAYQEGYVFKISQHGTATVALTASPNRAALGHKVTLTATVAAPSVSSAVTGSVTFKSGATTLATVVLSAGATGSASYTFLPSASGVETITASYSGNGTYSAGESMAVKLTVEPLGTVTTLKSSLNPAFPKEAITFTAKVKASSGTAIPSGTISILDGTKVLTTETLPASGIVTFSDSSLAVGTHAITARYNATTDFATSTSAPVSEVIDADIATKTALSASAASITVGTTVTLSAHVTPISGKAAPTGTVTFYLRNTLLGKVTLNTKGDAALATNALVDGTDPITAHYSGGIGDSASVSSIVNIKVSKAPAN